MITISDDDLIQPPVITRGSWMETVNEIHGIYPLRIVTIPVISTFNLFGSGENGDGQLGDPLIPNDTAGFVSLGDISAKDTAAGFNFSMIIKSDGSMWGAGRNGDGQLGLGHKTTPQVNWIQELSKSTWTAVTCGNDTTYGLKSDGTIWATGEDRYGNMGQGNTPDGTQTFYDEFIQVGIAADWVFIESSQFRLFAINSSGELWATGKNENTGALGLGDKVNRTYLTQVGSDTDWSQISSSSFSTIAIKTGGELFTWGESQYGALGNGTTSPDVLSPVQIGSDSWTYVGGCSTSHHAIKSDGTLWGTGENGGYELGLGDIVQRNSFTQIGSDSDWEKLFGIWLAMIAVKTNGRAYGAGESVVDIFGVGVSGDGYEHEFIALGDVDVGTTDYWTKFSTWGSYHYIGIRQ